MRKLIPATLIVAVTLISSSVIANAGQLMGESNLSPAPIGHLQPRASDFAATSPANQAEKDRLSAFDVEQQKLDEMLDKKLNICRC